VEYPHHPFFIASQFHPEFRSRPNQAHPLFLGLMQAALTYQASNLVEPISANNHLELVPLEI
jgi:CTP synthase